MPAAAVHHTELPNLLARGKVRDIYDLGDELMIVATDRISAFDVVMSDPIPGKGVLLTQMSRFWLETLPACRPHHLLYVVDEQRVPAGYASDRELLRGRAMVVRKAFILPIECIVRGYLVGSGWKEYRECGMVSGVRLPAGLVPAQRLEQPIFTPSTKATVGHDEPISSDGAIELLVKLPESWWSELSRATGSSVPPESRRAWAERIMEQVRTRSLDIYGQARAHAAERGIILADTKFEFGLTRDGLLLADEALTPDSSRFWPAESWKPGANPPSFDKQYLRDYLESLTWNKQPPPPPVPAGIIEQTRRRYSDAYERLSGPATVR